MFMAMGSTCHSFGPAVVLPLFINTSYENLPCRTGVPSNTTLCPICHISHSQAHHSGKTAPEYVYMRRCAHTCAYMNYMRTCIHVTCILCVCVYVNVYMHV